MNKKEYRYYDKNTCGFDFAGAMEDISVTYSVYDSETQCRERSGSVVECLTRDRRAAGSSLTGVTALWSLSQTCLS